MPELIEHIDAIGRRKGRAVLYLEFHPPAARRSYRYADDATRSSVQAWLNAHGIGWQACGPFANPQIQAPYLGQVYLDLPFDEDLPIYQELRDYLELPNGNMRQPGVRFYVLPLEHAMDNAAHDAPGYWENWAQQF